MQNGVYGDVSTAVGVPRAALVWAFPEHSGASASEASASEASASEANASEASASEASASEANVGDPVGAESSAVGLATGDPRVVGPGAGDADAIWAWARIFADLSQPWTRTQLLRLGGAILGCCALGACGADDTGASPPAPDAGLPPSCEIRVALAPAQPIAPVPIAVTAYMESHNASGVARYHWQVTHEQGAVAVLEIASDGSAIAFDAELPGPYRVVVEGELGATSCLGADETVNVGDSQGAPSAYRLRLIPAPGQPAPAQVRLVQAVSGVDYYLGTLSLSGSSETKGSLRTATAEPLAGYVRATGVGQVDPGFVEAFADADGSFALHLENRQYDVLVVPADNEHAPDLFRSVSAADLATLTIAPAQQLTGLVRAPDNTPLADARVSVRAGEVPSTIATTDAAGAFAVRTRLGSDPVDSAIAVTVVPPTSSPLPRLEVPASSALAAALQQHNGPLTGSYAADLRTTEVILSAVLADGVTPAANARATWVSQALPVAGFVTLSGGASFGAEGTVRRTVTANDSGAWPSIELPAAEYDLMIESAGPAGTVLATLNIDLRAHPPGPLAITVPPPAALRGTLTNTDNLGLPGIQVTATPLGLLAASPSAHAVTQTDSRGEFMLTVTGGGDYELVFASNGRYSRQRAVISAPLPGTTLDLGQSVLPPALRFTGQVTIPGVAGGAAGVTLLLHCVDCSADDSQSPLAEAVTDATGNFVLAVPNSTGQ